MPCENLLHDGWWFANWLSYVAAQSIGNKMVISTSDYRRTPLSNVQSATLHRNLGVQGKRKHRRSNFVSKSSCGWSVIRIGTALVDILHVQLKYC